MSKFRRTTWRGRLARRCVSQLRTWRPVSGSRFRRRARQACQECNEFCEFFLIARCCRYHGPRLLWISGRLSDLATGILGPARRPIPLRAWLGRRLQQLQQQRVGAARGFFGAILVAWVFLHSGTITWRREDENLSLSIISPKRVIGPTRLRLGR